MIYADDENTVETGSIVGSGVICANCGLRHYFYEDCNDEMMAQHAFPTGQEGIWEATGWWFAGNE